MLKKTLSLVLVLAMCLAVLAGCGDKETVNSPQNVTYDKNTGAVAFDALEGAKTYVVGVSKIINDTTGKALVSYNGSSPVTLADGSTVYVWSEQTGSLTGLADNDGDGKVDGKVVYREFSSSAEKVGAVKSATDLPLGHYILSVVPAATDELPNPETAMIQFTMGGTLAAPDGFTAQINQDGYMQITAPSSYYLNCLTVTGMPEKMVFEIKEGGSVVETIEMADFSYTNTVIGPNKSFTFNNGTVTGTTKLDASKAYTVTVTAKGDGGEIKDASAEAYMASDIPAQEFATKYSQSASGTAGALSMSLSLGVDGSGNLIYELTGSVSNMVVLRETGTFTASADVTIDGDKQYFAEGVTLTFTTGTTDADAPIMNGVVLTGITTETENWGQKTTTHGLTGNATVNGEPVEFSTSASGSGGSGGPGGS